MSSETYHEPYESLSTQVRDMHRAITSLGEELDAIDWYAQRAEGCADAELRAVLLHNRGEEIEHAMMVLEWIRRHDPTFDAKARTYLFTEAPITEIEVDDEAGDGARARPAGPSLAIGSLKPSAETP
jgi:ferritin-like protein